jgi:hypothetical protein
MTYSEKLRDPRWRDFKEQFLNWRCETLQRNRTWCDECGEDTQCRLHVHHSVYHHSAEPWDYDFEEMRLFCEDCHDRIHSLEKEMAAFIRSIEPHECYEFRAFFQELQNSQHSRHLKIALARATHAVRKLNEGTPKVSWQECLKMRFTKFEGGQSL